jgi:hypothetical protein
MGIVTEHFFFANKNNRLSRARQPQGEEERLFVCFCLWMRSCVAALLALPTDKINTYGCEWVPANIQMTKPKP